MKDGFQYGCNFILYDKGTDNHSHGHSLVLVTDSLDTEPIEHTITSFVRMASIVHKKAVFVLTDGLSVCNYCCDV